MTENIANIKLFGHFVTVKMRGHFSENIDTYYIKAYASICMSNKPEFPGTSL